MNWHIVTGSKGGSGKTLLSLMLTNYNRTNGEVLVIDLNGMNADISRLIAVPEKAKQRIPIKLDLGTFWLEKPEGQSYIIGWPEDAFTLLSVRDFQRFFLQVHSQVKQKIQETLSFGINTVIIDTNYHFCNIFPDRLADYAEEPWSFFSKEKGGQDSLFIWFLWTYRQIRNILDASDDHQHSHYRSVKTLVERAVLIESKIGNRLLTQSPFVHVLNPFSIGQFISIMEGSFAKLANLFRQKGSVTEIPALERLSRLKQSKTAQSLEFNALITNLKTVRTQLIKKQKEEKLKFSNTHEFFLALLDNYVEFLSKQTGCPRNLLPLHIFEKELIGYTESDYDNLLDGINDLKLYQESFVPNYGKLLTP